MTLSWRQAEQVRVGVGVVDDARESGERISLKQSSFFFLAFEAIRYSLFKSERKPQEIPTAFLPILSL